MSWKREQDETNRLWREDREAWAARVRANNERAKERAAEREAERELGVRLISIGRKELAKLFNRYGRDKHAMRRLNRICRRLRKGT